MPKSGELSKEEILDSLRYSVLKICEAEAKKIGVEISKEAMGFKNIVFISC
jgi:hypothetical protein